MRFIKYKQNWWQRIFHGNHDAQFIETLINQISNQKGVTVKIVSGKVVITSEHGSWRLNADDRQGLFDALKTIKSLSKNGGYKYE